MATRENAEVGLTVDTSVDTTERDASGGWLGRLLAVLTPPEPWEKRPASLAELWAYARWGAWTDPDRPPLHEGGRSRPPLSRWLGVWWCRLVTIPATVVTHYTAWVVARPSRTFTVAVLWGVLMHVRPLRVVAEWVLPWDPWPLP